MKEPEGSRSKLKKGKIERKGFFALQGFLGWGCPLVLLPCICAIRVNKPPLVNADLKLCSKFWCQPNLYLVSHSGMLLLSTMLLYCFHCKHQRERPQDAFLWVSIPGTLQHLADFFLLLTLTPHIVKVAKFPVMFYAMFLLESWLNLRVLLSPLISGLRKSCASMT